MSTSRFPERPEGFALVSPQGDGTTSAVKHFTVDIPEGVYYFTLSDNDLDSNWFGNPRATTFGPNTVLSASVGDTIVTKSGPYYVGPGASSAAIATAQEGWQTWGASVPASLQLTVGNWNSTQGQPFPRYSGSTIGYPFWVRANNSSSVVYTTDFTQYSYTASVNYAGFTNTRVDWFVDSVGSSIAAVCQYRGSFPDGTPNGRDVVYSTDSGATWNATASAFGGSAYILYNRDWFGYLEGASVWAHTAYNQLARSSNLTSASWAFAVTPMVYPTNGISAGSVSYFFAANGVFSTTDFTTFTVELEWLNTRLGQTAAQYARSASITPSGSLYAVYAEGNGQRMVLVSSEDQDDWNLYPMIIDPPRNISGAAPTQSPHTARQIGYDGHTFFTSLGTAQLSGDRHVFVASTDLVNWTTYHVKRPTSGNASLVGGIMLVWGGDKYVNRTTNTFQGEYSASLIDGPQAIDGNLCVTAQRFARIYKADQE